MSIYIFWITIVFFIQVSEQTISITQPANTPFQNNQLKYWYSNFGELHYGKSSSYELIVLDTGLCGSDEDLKIKHFTKPTYVSINGDQGQCSFPSRAFFAEQLGASGIIFGSTQINYAIGNVVISDDGHGRKIKINALFISPQSYEKLKTLKNINIKVNFPIVTRDKSDVQLFLTASQRRNYVFLRDFRPYYESIKDYVNLKISYHTFECQYCPEEQCILQKKCCAFDFQNFSYGTGKYIVKQQFRQYNIFNYAVTKKQIGKWFDYMNKFDQYCDYNWKNSEQCSKSILKQLGITENMNIADQYANMMEWRRSQTKTGVISYPDLSVNGLKHDETLSSTSAFSMICQSLVEPPSKCLGENQVPQSGNKTGLIVGLVITGVFLIIFGICCYRRIIKKQITNDMSSRVNELVAKYAVKVSEQKKKRKQRLMEKITEEI